MWRIAGRICAGVVLVVAVGAIAWKIVNSTASAAIAAPSDAPIMVIVDERDAGAKDAAPTIYVLWPGQRRIEAYNSGTMSFVSYDFVSRKVVSKDADVVF